MSVELPRQISAFQDFRRLVALPTATQLEELRATAGMITDSIKLGMISDPSRRFDLRFTFDGSVLNDHPVAALMIYEPQLGGTLAHGEILLNVEYSNLPVLFIHELAHYYDIYCFEPQGKFSSNISPEFEEWRRTIDSTRTFQKHRAALASLAGIMPSKLTDEESGIKEQLPTILTRDVLEWAYVEAFARCFCQWIVGQWTGNSTHEIGAVVDYFYKESHSSEAKALSAYWTQEEMQPIGHSLSTLVAAKSGQ